MNWKGNRKDPALDGPPATPFRLTPEMERQMLDGVKREDTPRISEYAPRLRDRIEAATNLTMQERDKATQAMIHEATIGIEQVRELAAQAEQKYERLISAIQEVTKKANEEQQQTLDRILSFCDLLDQVKEPPQPRNHKPKAKAALPAPPAPEDNPEAPKSWPPSRTAEPSS